MALPPNAVGTARRAFLEAGATKEGEEIRSRQELIQWFCGLDGHQWNEGYVSLLLSGGTGSGNPTVVAAISEIAKTREWPKTDASCFDRAGPTKPAAKSDATAPARRRTASTAPKPTARATPAPSKAAAAARSRAARAVNCN